MATFSGWEQAVLKQLGAPVTPTSIALLRQWASKEGGSARYNPLNTTQPWKGASNYNGVGVKNFPTAAAGIAATVKTLKNGHYNNIVAQLKTGQPGWTKAVGDELNTWGTGSHAWEGFRPGDPHAAPGTSPAPPPTQAAPTAAPTIKAPDWQAAFKHDAANNLLQQSIALAQPQAPNAPPGANVQQFTQGIMDMANMRSQYQAAAEQFGQSAQPSQVDKHGTLDHPKDAIPVVANGQSKGAAVLHAAMQQIGQPYVWGGESRKEGGFDCSGLIDWAMRQQGYKGDRITTYNAVKMGQEVPKNQLQPGDWIITHNGGHIVIYAGNGKVLAAPHTGTVVQYQPLSNFNIEHIRRV